MLEDPTYASIVRWGDEGDSFVVLEVMRPWLYVVDSLSLCAWLTQIPIVREIYQDHPAEALQTQQLCQFCTPTE
jgi:osomolarity two-component system response regulator SKN7